MATVTVIRDRRASLRGEPSPEGLGVNSVVLSGKFSAGGVSMCLMLMYMTGQENMMFLLYRYLIAVKYGFSDMGEA